MLKEAEKLHTAGFGIHWIKENSKAPVKSNWSDAGRDDWESLKRTYQKGYGLGVRLGESSRLPSGHYLANIDVDIKSSDPRHRKEALREFDERFPGIRGNASYVKTGYGVRYFIALEKPLPSFKVIQSSDVAKVFMPSGEINQRQKNAVREGLLTAEELSNGMRIRSAWEIDFLSIGKQVIIPPSIHPDTKKPYVWGDDLDSLEAVKRIPLVSEGLIRSLSKGRTREDSHELKTKNDFKFVEVDLIGSTLPDNIVDMILSGKGVEDRSASLFTVAIVMLRNGFTHDEIISVLTDKETFLGEAAFDHRKTKNRSNAARWIRDHTLRKAIEETSAASAFDDEVGVAPLIEDQADQVKQADVLTFRKHGDNWQVRIRRAQPKKDQEGDPAPLAILFNFELILRKVLGDNFLRRDTFVRQDVYGVDVQWNREVSRRAGERFDYDRDISIVKAWFAEKWRINKIDTTPLLEALNNIAQVNEFNSEVERYDRLPAWDGVERAKYLFTDRYWEKTPPHDLHYIYETGLKWLYSIILRGHEPGSQADQFPVLEGEQGAGKGTFGRILFGKDRFLGRLPDIRNKDAMQALLGKNCVELAELAAVKKVDVEEIKAFLSTDVDTFRMPYARTFGDYPRTIVFYGTVNEQEYFKDPTGNRRYNPMEISSLRREALARDREQIFAEVLWYYRSGEITTPYIDAKAEVYAKLLRATKMTKGTSDYMAAKIYDYVQQQHKLKIAAEIEAKKAKKKIIALSPAFDFSSFRIAALFEAGPLMEWSRLHGREQYAARALKMLGAQQHHTKVGNVWSLDLKLLISDLSVVENEFISTENEFISSDEKLIPEHQKSNLNNFRRSPIIGLG